MDKEKILAEEEIAEVSGGLDSFEGKMAKVYSLDGGNVKLYESTFSGGNVSHREVPNGTEMEVEPDLRPAATYANVITTEAGYWAVYNRICLYLRQSEVRLEWL